MRWPGVQGFPAAGRQKAAGCTAPDHSAAKRSGLYGWVLLAAAVAGCGSPPSAVDGDIAFVNVNVVSMLSDEVTPGQTVIVEGGVVTRIVPEGNVTLADGVLAIDGAGRYLMPALADMHTHVADTESLRLNVAYGVTALRNLWGNEEVLAWRDAVAAGDLFGPEILTASPIIDHDPPSIPGSALLTRPEDADAMVKSFKEQGYDFLKPYRLLKEDVYIAMMDASEKYGIPVEGHMPEAIDVAQAIELGHDVIEHATGFSAAIVAEGIPWNPAFRSREMVETVGRINAGELEYEQVFRRDRLRELSRLAARSGTAVSVTFQAVGLRALSGADRQALREHPLIGYVAPESLGYWFAADFDSVLPGDDAFTDAEIDSLESFVTGEFGAWIGIMHEEGVLLLGGTDAANPGLFHGWSLHDELANLVRWAGLSPHQAIETVTVNAAKYWQKEGERGIVAAGAEADLLLLGANPLADITNTRTIEGLVIDGLWLDRGKLDDLLDSVADSYAARLGAATPSGSR